MHKSNMHAAITIAAIISTLETAPSYAFTLTDTSARFEDDWVSNGEAVDRAAPSSSFSRYEQFVIDYVSDRDDDYDDVEFIDFVTHLAAADTRAQPRSAAR